MNAGKPTLFIDRDGTLIEEPPDEQVDDYAKTLFHTGGFRPIGPIEPAWPEPFNSAAETFLRNVVGIPFGLAKTQIIHAAQICQLFKAEFILISQNTANFQPGFDLDLSRDNSACHGTQFHTLTEAAGK